MELINRSSERAQLVPHSCQKALKWRREGPTWAANENYSEGESPSEKRAHRENGM